MQSCNYDVLARNVSTDQYYSYTVQAANIIHAYELSLSHFVIVEKISKSDLEIISVKRKG